LGRRVHVPRAPDRVRRPRLDGILRGDRMSGIDTPTNVATSVDPGDDDQVEVRAGDVAPRDLDGGRGGRLTAIAMAITPVLVLAAIVAAVLAGGDRILDGFGHNP